MDDKTLCKRVRGQDDEEQEKSRSYPGWWALGKWGNMPSFSLGITLAPSVTRKLRGRAYQKRSVAMIQLCRLFLEISPGKPDQIDALRSLFETVEDALKSAVDAGKDRSDAADAAFATAEEELDWYAAWHHPKEQEVLGDVQHIIEDAAQKDNYIAKTHKRLSTRLGLNKSGSPPSSSLVKVHFQILRSPTDRREAPVVTCELGPDVKISELLWTFSRLPEDQRIGLKQNPHFYFSKDLSDQASAYDDQFKLEPLKDLRPEKDSVVMVLLDRAGQIFVDYQQFSKTYGNIWRPDNTIILKDLQGTLEAANLINPKINGEVCIWQRGGGRPVEEDLLKWTQVLDRALDLPDVDWLIRSETAPDEALDIELTGGWERCSRVTIPDPPGLSEQDDPTSILPPHEDAFIAPEEPSSPVSLVNTSVSTVDTANQEVFHPPQDVFPSKITVEISSEEARGIAEECPSIVEDKDFLILGISSPSGSPPPQVEAAIHPPVNPAFTSLDLFTPPGESEPAPTSTTSAPERVAPMAAESIRSQNEAVHAQTLLACSSSNPLTLDFDSTVASSSSGVLTPVKNGPSDDTKVSHPPVQPACVPPESTPLNRTELALASSASTPDRIPDLAHSQAEAIRAPDHLGHHPIDHPIPSIGDNVEPASVVSTRSRTTTSDSTLSQAEAANLPNTFPNPPILAKSAPILNHTALAPDAASDTTSLRFKIDRPAVQSARSPENFVLPTGNVSASPSSMPIPDKIPPFSGRARSSSRVEKARQPLVMESPPALPAPPGEPTLPAGKKQSPPTGSKEGMQAPHVSPSTLERVRTPVEAARSPNRNSSAPSKPRVSSVVAGSVPTLHRTHPPPELRRAHAAPPSGPRTSLGGQLPLKRRVCARYEGGAFIFAVQDKEPSEEGGDSHRAATVDDLFNADQRAIGYTVIRFTCGELYCQPGAGLHPIPWGITGKSRRIPKLRHMPRAASNSTARMYPQDPTGQSRRIAGRVSSQLLAPRPVEKPVPGTAPGRNSPVPVTRQDRTPVALPHSSHAKSSNLVPIPEAMKLNSPSQQNNISRTSSVVNLKDPALQTRKSIALPEQTTSQLAVRLQPIANRVSSSSNSSDPVTMARLGKTAEALSHSPRADISSAVTGAMETRGEFNRYSMGPKVLPSPPVGGTATISTSPMWNGTARTPSRIKTKDLISRHKQRNSNNMRPTSTAESASPSRAPTSALSQTAALAGKSSASRIDSGIELWDIDHHGASPDRRRGSDTPANGYGNLSRDRGPSSPHPTGSPVGTRNTTNREDGISTSLSSKKSRMSMSGLSSPVGNPAHSGIPIPPPEQAKNPLLNVTFGSSSTGSLASTSPGRREPFINRKPQPTSQTTSQGRATPQSGFSTPPRSSTPSSFSHSASTSTRATMVTPATSFTTIPSRVPSPVAEVGSKSWFRRNVIDAVKSKLGYGS
ncbi:hypothetical protein BJV77DRAFT_1151150 [Russula vinacea]|nr:hypothetical protein BJV77DRAFT_1151150 [Russula vinacea]